MHSTALRAAVPRVLSVVFVFHDWQRKATARVNNARTRDLREMSSLVRAGVYSAARGYVLFWYK